MITPPLRVAMARPVTRPVARVRRQLGTPCRTIRTIESVDQLMANRNGTSIGAKNRLPYRKPVSRHRASAVNPAQHPTVSRAIGTTAASPARPNRKVMACRTVIGLASSSGRTAAMSI